MVKNRPSRKTHHPTYLPANQQDRSISAIAHPSHPLVPVPSYPAIKTIGLPQPSLLFEPSQLARLSLLFEPYQVARLSLLFEPYQLSLLSLLSEPSQLAQPTEPSEPSQLALLSLPSLPSEISEISFPSPPAAATDCAGAVTRRSRASRRGLRGGGALWRGLLPRRGRLRSLL